MNQLPNTINYHFASACNMRCRFCFARFPECAGRGLTLNKHKQVVRLLAEQDDPANGCQIRRINFVGGEPTVYPYLEDLLLEAKNQGLQTSIVSNGFTLAERGLPPVFQTLDLLGLSIDSLDPTINRLMGRTVGRRSITATDWMLLFDQAAIMNLPIKINTTVSRFNVHEDFSAFIVEAAPVRWKVFQAMAVEGQNGCSRMSWEIDTETFECFVSRHLPARITPVVEPVEVMRGSYSRISPDGRFFDSTTGEHRYSDPILEVGVETAWCQISFDRHLFNLRTRSYSKEAAENE